MNKGMKIIVILMVTVIIVASAAWFKLEYYSGPKNGIIDDSTNHSKNNGTNNSTTNGSATNNTQSHNNNNTSNSTTNKTTVLPHIMDNRTSKGFFIVNYAIVPTDGSYERPMGHDIPMGWLVNRSENITTTIEIFRYISNWTDWNLTFVNDNTIAHHFSPDFHNYTYSLIYWGYQMSSGYSIRYSKVQYANGSLNFYYYKIWPNGVVFTVITEPNSLIQIPRNQFDKYKIDDVNYYYQADI